MQTYENVACVNFQNSINFFYLHTSFDQWNYVCNFLFDIFQINDVTRHFFDDVCVPMRFSIRKILFRQLFHVNNKRRHQFIFYKR